MNTPYAIILHHTASPLNTKVGDVDRWHKTRNFPRSRRGYFVGYHYFIEQNGFVTQTRDHNEEGAHTIGQNRRSIGICLAGNFNLEYPTKEQIKALTQLLTALRKEIGDLPARPHRHYARTDCFGTNLPDNYFDVAGGQVSFIELLQMWKSYLISLKGGTMK